MYSYTKFYDMEKAAGYDNPNQHREWYHDYKSYHAAESQIKRRSLRKLPIDDVVNYWYFDILGNTHIPRKQIDSIKEDMKLLQSFMQRILNTCKGQNVKIQMPRYSFTVTETIIDNTYIKHVIKVGKKTGWWSTVAITSNLRVNDRQLFWNIDLKINENKFLTKKDIQYHRRIFLAIKNTYGKDISGIIMKIMLKNDFISYPINLRSEIISY